MMRTIATPRYGVSFSIKQCRSFGMAWQPVMRALIKDLGVRRFRVMSYWNEHEKVQGKYDFTALDKQIEMIEKAGGAVTLCLGARQPRWPENHWPAWAWELDYDKRTEALTRFITAVVNRYKLRSCVVSYQLENEALLTQFGERPEVNRKRLRNEFKLVQQLDPRKPIIMTTSTSWGVPIRKPIPDLIGFSYYQILFRDGKYTLSFHKPLLDRIRAKIIKLLHRKPSFIHELQTEPWGPKNIWEMDLDEQFKSMSIDQLKENLRQAEATGLYPIDLWGAEWWYWLKTKRDAPAHWNAIQSLLKD